VSYAWGGESEAIVDEICAAFEQAGYAIIRDKSELTYRDSIKDFMDRIGRGSYIIVIISDKYMKSEYCMYEAYRMFQSPEFRERVFPIVLPDAKIFGWDGQTAYVQHWMDEVNEMEAEIKLMASDEPTMLGPLIDRLKDYELTSRFVNDFMHHVADMNVLTPELHVASGYRTLIEEVEGKPKPDSPSNTPTPERVAAVTPRPEIIDTLVVKITNPFEMELIQIPEGEFLMGSKETEEGWSKREELPQHHVYLPEFYIAKYPVTRSQYGVFLEQGEGKKPDNWDPDLNPDHPMVEVSWNDAIAFCEWLSDLTGQLYQLPSEAEWENAARGPWDDRIFPWGSEFDQDKMNSEDSGVGETIPVGTFSPQGDSPYGVADMSGNVWEWTRSLWGREFDEPKFKYPYNPKDGREDLSNTGFRVLRGGSFSSMHDLARVSYRNWSFPYKKDDRIGFRVVTFSKPQ
jgi:formylglycine-generating enzyme required for sulfatase activity